MSGTSLATLFGFGRSSSDGDELPMLYPMPMELTQFVDADVLTIYQKILIDTLERTNGLTPDQISLMWDSCLKSNKSDGLITMLAKAMSSRRELFLVYEKGVGVIREATASEQQEIQNDYATQAKSSRGLYISFKNFVRADMVRLYVALEYYAVTSLNKSMGLSKAIQFKMNDMRASTSLTDKAEVKAQAQTIARALANGRDVMLDAKDVIETAKPDLTATNETITFTTKKLSFYLGLPSAYLVGEQTGGLGTTGEGDSRAIERGLKVYFFSVLKPVLDALFGVSVKYKSQDFRQIVSAMEVIKTFALVDEEFISRESKTKIINALLDLPEDAEGDDAPPSDPSPSNPPVAKAPAGTGAPRE